MATTKTGSRRTASKLSRWGGGDDSAVLLEEAKDLTPDGGITAGLASIAAADGQKYIEAVPVAAVAPHPFNPPARSAPQPDSARWSELVNSVRAAGVQVPILLVSRDAFVGARPSLESALGPDAKYVIVYGHRRRAAAEAAGLETIPAVLDDSVLADGGDLDAMTIENLGREELTGIQRAEIFAYYSEAGLGQRAIAEKLGFDQSTVSRWLSLLLLAPEVLRAVEAGEIKTTEASALAGQLPYGPPRPWQQDPESGQESEERRAEQVEAYHLILSGSTPKRAAERVLAERRARKRAAAEGVEIVDATARFGPDHQRYALRSPSEANGAVVAAIDSVQGGLVYYPSEAPARESRPEPVSDRQPKAADSKQRTAALKSRRAAGPRLVASPPPREKLLPLLAGQYSAALTSLATSSAGWALAYEFSRSAGLMSSEHPDVAAYRAAAGREVELKRQLEIAWASAVAAYELHAADKGRSAWNHIDLAYMQLLQDRADYSPTPWERERIAAASAPNGAEE